MIKSILRAVKWLLFIYALLLAVTYFFQENLIFHPEKLPQAHEFSLTGNFNEVNLTTQDYEVINALHLKVKNPKGVILYFHGNTGSLKRWGQIASFFTEFDYDVFVIDYRSYGKSTGAFNETNMYKDAQLSYDFLKDNYKEKEIVIYGRSLGTTFATKVASENNPRQLILEAPFFSLIDITKERFFLIPAFLLKYKFKTNEFIKNVKCPLTIIHGTADRVTPYQGGKRLFEEAIIEDKQFATIEEGGHNNLIEFDLYKENIKTLLN